MFYLQSRWKTEKDNLVYYGMRYGKNLNKNVLKLKAKQKKILSALPKELNEKEKHVLKNLIETGAIAEREPMQIPESLSKARFCKQCSANDFIIPGLEFGEDGLCPMCESRDRTKNLKSVVPLVSDIPKAKKSRFDVAVFYTGGKDSTFLLYYLSKVKKLRVLALSWIIPYASDSALKSIENAGKYFDGVEFITRRICAEDLRKIYEKLYELNENTCACPSLAYVLFYPTLVEENIPYFVAGNEPAQLAGLYYNRMAPEIAYKFPDRKSTRLNSSH